MIFRYFVFFLVILFPFVTPVFGQSAPVPIASDNVRQITEIASFVLEDLRTISLSPDNRVLAAVVDHHDAAAPDNGVYLWNMADLLDGTANAESPLAFLPGDYWTAEFSPDGELLAAGGADTDGGESESITGSVHIYDMTTYQEVAILKGYPGQEGVFIQELAFNPQGTLLATRDGTIGLWDVQRALNKKKLTMDDDMRFVQPYRVSLKRPISALAWNTDGNILAYSTYEDVEFKPRVYHNFYIRLWDINTGTETRVLQGHTNMVWKLAFSPDNQTLASGSGDVVEFQGYTPIYGDDNTVRLWDVQTGELRFTLNHTALIWSLGFSPNGSLLAVGDYDGQISFWNVQTGVNEMIIEDAHDVNYAGVVDLEFSADGTMLISAGDERIRFWGIANN